MTIKTVLVETTIIRDCFSIVLSLILFARSKVTERDDDDLAERVEVKSDINQILKLELSITSLYIYLA